MRTSASEERWGEEAIAARLDAQSGAELMGTLPCAVCKYDLQGLSVAGQCPECGTMIRATILYRVDPLSEEFRPLRFPRFIAGGLIAWTVGGALAGILSWVPNLLAWLPGATRDSVLGVLRLIPGFEPGQGGALALACVTLSACGMLGLLRPVKGAPRPRTIAAALAFAAYIPLILLMYRLMADGGPGYASDEAYRHDALRAEPLLLRLGIGACLLTIVLGVRPNARELVRRCLAIRAGRVDRQTLIAMAAAVGLCALGDVARLGSMPARGAGGWWLDHMGMLMVLIGSALFTVGLLGCIVDALRIARSILMPSPSLTHVLGGSRKSAAEQQPGATSP